MIALRSTGLAFVAALALAPAAHAGNTWDGFVAVGGSLDRFGFTPSVPGVDLVGHSENIRLSVARMFPGNWGVQFDALLDHQVIGDGDPLDTQWESKGEAALHAFYRQPGHFLFGAIYQYGGEFAENFGSPQLPRSYTGLEGEIYHGNFSLYAKGAFLQYYGIPGFGQGKSATLRARYYIKPNWRVEGFGRWTEVADEPGLITLWDWGGGTEYQFASTPFSVGLKYEHERTLVYFGQYDTDSVLGTFRWAFNDRSLMANDQDGASLDPFGEHRFIR